MKISSKILATAALVVSSPAVAATDDFQQWTTVSVNAPLGGGFLGSAEIVGRFTDNADRLGQLESRVQIGRRVSKSVVVWLGYVHLVSYAKAGRDGIEEQAVEQVSWTVGRFLGGTLSSRTRFEQKFQRGVSKTAFRVREQVRLSVPLHEKGPNALIWVEPFVSLNDTSAVRSGLDQVRSFAGLDVPLFKGANVEAGYLNQYLNRPSGDRSNHTLSVTLGYRF